MRSFVERGGRSFLILGNNSRTKDKGTFIFGLRVRVRREYPEDMKYRSLTSKNARERIIANQMGRTSEQRSSPTSRYTIIQDRSGNN
jgi:hypothetical protein